MTCKGKYKFSKSFGKSECWGKSLSTMQNHGGSSPISCTLRLTEKQQEGRGEQCCAEHVESLRPHSDTGLVLLPEVMLLSPRCTESPFSAF